MARQVRGAGQLQGKFAFDKRSAVDDGYGNEVSGPWVEQFQQHAGLTPVRGGEGIEAARLEGKQSFVLRTRKSAQADLVTTDWRCRDLRKGTEFNIRSVTTDDSRGFLDMVIDTGVAEG